MSRVTLEKFLQRVDPGSPPPDDAYVEPPSKVGERLAIAVQPNPKSRVLFVGQPGVGKSTEFARLELKLSDRYVVLRPPIDTIDLRAVGWTELIAFSALWAAEHVGVHAWKLLAALRKVAWRPDWADPNDDLGPEEQGYEQVAGPPRATIAQHFRNELPQISEAIAQGPAQIRDLAAAVFKEIEATKGKPVVILWDGLERLSSKRATELFERQVLQMKDLPCRVVATAPVWLSFQTFFGEVMENFGEVVRLRALDPESAATHAFMSEVISRRDSDDLFEFGSIKDEILTASGGIVRQLLQLIAFVVAQVLADGGTELTFDAFERGKRRAAERWQYQLGPDDFHELTKDDKKRKPEARARLLSLGALVEYEDSNGGLKLETNPLVADLMKRRNRA